MTCDLFGQAAAFWFHYSVWASCYSALVVTRLSSWVFSLLFTFLVTASHFLRDLPGLSTHLSLTLSRLLRFLWLAAKSHAFDHLAEPVLPPQAAGPHFATGSDTPELKGRVLGSGLCCYVSLDTRRPRVNSEIPISSSFITWFSSPVIRTLSLVKKSDIPAVFKPEKEV